MTNQKMLSIILALPIAVSGAGNTFARDSLLKPPDLERWGANPQRALAQSPSETALWQLMAARGEQPGRCELLGICK